MLKIRLTATETVMNFQNGFGWYGVYLLHKIVLMSFDGDERAVFAN